MKVLRDCATCEGVGTILVGLDCGKPCTDCHGLGIIQVPVDDERADDVVFGSLPVGWTKEHAKALLSRIHTGRPVVIPDNVWSPYPWPYGASRDYYDREA